MRRHRPIVRLIFDGAMVERPMRMLEIPRQGETVVIEHVAYIVHSVQHDLYHWGGKRLKHRVSVYLK